MGKYNHIQFHKNEEGLIIQSGTPQLRAFVGVDEHPELRPGIIYTAILSYYPGDRETRNYTKMKNWPDLSDSKTFSKEFNRVFGNNDGRLKRDYRFLVVNEDEINILKRFGVLKMLRSFSALTLTKSFGYFQDLELTVDGREKWETRDVMDILFKRLQFPKFHRDYDVRFIKQADRHHNHVNMANNLASLLYHNFQERGSFPEEVEQKRTSLDLNQLLSP